MNADHKLLETVFLIVICRQTGERQSKTMVRIVMGHRLEIIIDHRLESVAAVDAIF